MRLLNTITSAPLLIFLLFAFCGTPGCEERLLVQQLKSYGVEVQITDHTVEELRRMLRDTREHAFEVQQEAVSAQNKAVAQSAFECRSLSTGTPRGIACLHCMQPEARTQASALVTVLHQSCLQHVAINYLADGTFGFDKRLLYKHIELLTSGGRTLHLYFYITNGATQRRYNSTSIRAFGTQISPEDFRSRIMKDKDFRKQYQMLVIRLLPIIRFAETHGAVVNLIPMLEDNLTNEAFVEMLSLTLNALPKDVNPRLGRNPCLGCYKGNQGSTPDGIFLEVHTASPYFGVSNGVVTNDGYFYPLDRIALVRDAAPLRNSTFILWDSERQGLAPNYQSVGIKPPNKRSYPIPSLRERADLIRFLRGD